MTNPPADVQEFPGAEVPESDRAIGPPGGQHQAACSKGDCVGRAEDEDGFVVVEYGQTGVRELTLHPKAMRLSSGELADLIKQVLAEATDDFQRRLTEMAGEVFGEKDNPLKAVENPDAMIDEIKRVEKVYDQAFNDVMGELDRIRRRLEL